MYTWEGYSNRSVSYPEHVYTLEGYSNHSVSSCVCLCVCLLLVLSSIQLVVSSVLFDGTFL